MSYVAYDFTSGEAGQTFEEWGRPLSICPACGRLGLNDDEAIPNTYIHVMAREEELEDEAQGLWRIKGMFWVHEFCFTDTGESLADRIDLINELPNHVKAPHGYGWKETNHEA